MVPLNIYSYSIDNSSSCASATGPLSRSKRPKQQLQQDNNRNGDYADCILMSSALTNANLPIDMIEEILKKSHASLFKKNLFAYCLQVSRAVHELVKKVVREWLESQTFQSLTTEFKNETQLIRCMGLLKPVFVNFSRCGAAAVGDINSLAEVYPELTKLSLRLTTIEAIPKAFVALEELDLGGCDEITDGALQDFHAIPYLKKLILWNCNQITDDGLQFLKHLDRLEILNLGHCFQITGAGFNNLAKMKRLRNLGCYNCDRLKDTGLESLRKLQLLEELDLRRCFDLTENSLAILSNFPALKIVKLSEISTEFKTSKYRAKGRLPDIMLTL